MQTAYRLKLPSLALVALQMSALATVVFPWGAAGWSHWSWPVLAAAAALGVWTLAHNSPGNFSVFPEPLANARLVTTGPYAFVRHPMYLAVLLLAVGFAIGWRGIVHAAACVVLIFVLYAKAVREERLLRERFAEYAAYQARTARIVPRPRAR